MRSHRDGSWFPGLKLSAKERRSLKAMTAGGRAVPARLWRRIRILEVLHQGRNVTQAAEAVGTYAREVRRVGWRFLDGGIGKALSDEARPKPSKMLDAKQESALVAMVCSQPPDGCARWTIRLAAEEARRRGIVATVARETIRRTFLRHDLKPWREKNVVRSQDRR